MNRENLWAPWRQAYLRELTRRSSGLDTGTTLPADFLAEAWESPDHDLENLVIHRDEHGLLMLNRYPYANGHLLAALGTARAGLLEYTPEERHALWDLVDTGVDCIQRTLAVQGLNIGINQHAAAGAGLPEHLHVHIIPRWHGDTNFFSTVGEVRVIPDALEAMAEKFRRTLSEST